DPNETKKIFASCFRYPRLLLPWSKGRHIAVKELAKIGQHPLVIKRLNSILGRDILLWGSMLIRQPSFAKHPLHVDLEHNEWDGISIWIGMRNVISGSSFSVIPGSHLFDISPQELQLTQKIDGKNDVAVLEAAKELNPSCQLKYLEV